jgi:hypothetical protein
MLNALFRVLRHSLTIFHALPGLVIPIVGVAVAALILIDLACALTICLNCRVQLRYHIIVAINIIVIINIINIVINIINIVINIVAIRDWLRLIGGDVGAGHLVELAVDALGAGLSRGRREAAGDVGVVEDIAGLVGVGLCGLRKVLLL